MGPRSNCSVTAAARSAGPGGWGAGGRSSTHNITKPRALHEAREGNGPIRGGQRSPAPSDEENCGTRLFPYTGDSPGDSESKLSDPRRRPIWSCEMAKTSKKRAGTQLASRRGACGILALERVSRAADAAKHERRRTRLCGQSGWPLESRLTILAKQICMHGIWVASEHIFLCPPRFMWDISQNLVWPARARCPLSAAVRGRSASSPHASAAAF